MDSTEIVLALIVGFLIVGGISLLAYNEYEYQIKRDGFRDSQKDIWDSIEKTSKLHAENDLIQYNLIDNMSCVDLRNIYNTNEFKHNKQYVIDTIIVKCLHVQESEK